MLLDHFLDTVKPELNDSLMGNRDYTDTEKEICTRLEELRDKYGEEAFSDFDNLGAQYNYKASLAVDTAYKAGVKDGIRMMLEILA